MNNTKSQSNEQKVTVSARSGQISANDLINAAVGLLDTHRSVSSLGLREIARAANIAPNSFYRHFRDVDELTVALIDQAGRSLRGIIREARLRLSPKRSAIRTSIEAFMDQLDSEDKYLQILLREMSIGSEAFRKAADRELNHFEDELCDELVRMQEAIGAKTHEPALAAKAITRLVFAMGATTADATKEERQVIIEQTVVMLRMIMVGAQALAKKQSE